MKSLANGMIIQIIIQLWSNQNVTVGCKYDWTEDKRKRSVRPFISQVSGWSTTSGHFPVNQKSRVLVLTLSLPVCNLSSSDSPVPPLLSVYLALMTASLLLCVSAVYQTLAWTLRCDNTNTNKIYSKKNQASTYQKTQGLQQLQNLILLLINLFFALSEKVNCENSTGTSNSRLSHNASVRGQNVRSAVNLAFSYFQELHFPT